MVSAVCFLWQGFCVWIRCMGELQSEYVSAHWAVLFLDCVEISVSKTVSKSNIFVLLLLRVCAHVCECVCPCHRKRNWSVWSGSLPFSPRLQRQPGVLPAILMWAVKSWRNRGRLLIWMHWRSSRKLRTLSMSTGSALARSPRRERHLS